MLKNIFRFHSNINYLNQTDFRVVYNEAMFEICKINLDIESPTYTNKSNKIYFSEMNSYYLCMNKYFKYEKNLVSSNF